MPLKVIFFGLLGVQRGLSVLLEPSFRIKSLWWIAFLQGLCSQRERLATVGVGGRSPIMKINSGSINLWPKSSRHLLLLSLPTPLERSAPPFWDCAYSAESSTFIQTPGSDGHRAFEYTVYYHTQWPWVWCHIAHELNLFLLCLASAVGVTSGFGAEWLCYYYTIQANWI